MLKKIAEERQLRYSFDTVPVGNFHPNSVRVILISEDNKELTLVASSLGGGKAEVQEIEKLPLKFTGEQPTLVFYHDDSIGFIADITLALTKRGYNIARFANERWNKAEKPFLSVLLILLFLKVYWKNLMKKYQQLQEVVSSKPFNLIQL